MDKQRIGSVHPCTLPLRGVNKSDRLRPGIHTLGSGAAIGVQLNH